jgi:hypothetical protein
MFQATGLFSVFTACILIYIAWRRRYMNNTFSSGIHTEYTVLMDTLHSICIMEQGAEGLEHQLTQLHLDN